MSSDLASSDKFSAVECISIGRSITELRVQVSATPQPKRTIGEYLNIVLDVELPN